MKTAKLVTLAAASATMMMATGQAQAQLAGTLQSQLVLESACLITGQTATSGLDFGMLDFGTQPSTFTGAVNSTLAGGLSLTCSAGITGVTVAVDLGQHAAGLAGGIANGTTGTRAMSIGSSTTDVINYDVYPTDGGTVPYPALGSSVPVSGSTAVPFFGKINRTTATGLAAGTYTDTLAVTISW